MRVWAAHVSNAGAGAGTGGGLCVSVFPERDRSCWFMVVEGEEDGGLCRTPVGCREGRASDGLMTLRGFVQGGFEVVGGRVLVAVKSIGGRKKCRCS